MSLWKSHVVSFPSTEITCPPIPIPPHAELKMSHCTNRYNQECIVECHTGYNATNGNSARTCLETGQWNGTNITCTGNGMFKLGLTECGMSYGL